MRRRSSKDIISGILAKSNGLRAKVNAHCVSCIYDDHAPGTWRQQVEACAVTECPLYPVRPRSFRKQSSKDDSHINSEPVHCEVGPKIGSIAT